MLLYEAQGIQERLMVTISRGQQPPFKGFFAQARLVRDPSLPPVGRFYTKQHATVSCGAAQANSITHADSKEKEAVTLLWESPASLDEEVAFRVTVVQNYRTFWVNHDSARVRVSESGQEPPAPADAVTPSAAAPSAAAPPPTKEEPIDDMTHMLVPRRPKPNRSSPSPRTTEPTCTENCEPSTTTASLAGGNALETVYDACLLSKGCFALSDGCLQGRNCDLMVTHSRLSSGAYRFQLYGRFQPGNYLGLGLSRDKIMGSDAVVYCATRDDGGFQVLHAYNLGKQAFPMQATSREGPLVSDFSSEYRDGLLLCEFTHSPRFTVRGEDFDLVSDDLHLMMVSGTASADSERRPQYHRDSRRVSAAPVRLASAGAAAGDSGLLFRVHGALMVIAWLGTASVGMLLARYYKQTWVGRKLAGLDLWFQGHRTLMVITVLLSLAGLVCVFIQVGGWTATPMFGAEGANPHPLLGIICVALAVLQPLMALCRCHPTASRRPIFNWLHWMVGSAAHNLGIVTIFFAVKLPAAQLPFWTYWVLVIFVVLHVLTHLAMSAQHCVADRAARGHKTTSEAYRMRDMATNGYSGQQAAAQDDAPGGGFRRALLGLYIFENLVLVTLLVVMIVLAPADSWGSS
ncbi:putative ferric-chelate reductase 1 homolog [Pollicipes pollicipes]|uniref:putative ferric-chelate reductase 1 homolog n=1 Tax=Pollicipes pollicipes TaxID=41117 RepID=UPI00188597C0|nr:putative ferric-chelate reductase 1 homolog [Pollicipes pollicipes]